MGAQHRVPLVGYEGRGVEQRPAGRYSFALQIMALEAWYAGDDTVVRVDRPLVAEMTRARPEIPARGP